MDQSPFKEALLRKRGEILAAGGAAKPLTDVGRYQYAPGRSRRSGERQQRSSYPAQTEADRREDSAGHRRSALPHGKGHLRHLPRLRRADCPRTSQRDSLDACLHHLQGKTKHVKATELLDFLREFHRDKLAMLRRHEAVGPVRQRLRLQQHLPVRDRPRGDARQLGA